MTDRPFLEYAVSPLQRGLTPFTKEFSQHRIPFLKAFLIVICISVNYFQQFRLGLCRQILSILETPTPRELNYFDSFPVPWFASNNILSLNLLFALSTLNKKWSQLESRMIHDLQTASIERFLEQTYFLRLMKGKAKRLWLKFVNYKSIN